MIKKLIALIIIGLLFLTLAINKTTVNPLNDIKEKSLPSVVDYKFQEVGFSLKVPSDMTVNGNLENGTDFILYIQKSEYPKPDYYQLYGIYKLSQETDLSIDDFKKELIEDTIVDTKIAGFASIQGQYKGERNRFVSIILTDKGIFTLATSQPTQENYLITENILTTLKLE